MCWKESKTVLRLFALSVLIFSCSSPDSSNSSQLTVDDQKKNAKPFSKEHISRLVESKLAITATENYSIQLKRKHINSDTLEDCLILVNRKDYSFKRAKNTDTEGFFKRTGYTGPYNYVFVMLGGQDKLLDADPISSSVNHPLENEFLTLTSMAHTDFYVSYRIRNSLHRNYYTVRNNKLHLTLSCPIFDSIGTKHPIVYKIKHIKSPVRISKDVAIYKGKFSSYNPDTIQDITNYDPKEILSTDSLYVYFIFDSKRLMYVTPMQPDVD